MTLDALIMGAGAFVALLPFLGFPASWDRVLFLLAGAFVIGLGVAARRKRGREETEMRHKHLPPQEPAETPSLDS